MIFIYTDYILFSIAGICAALSVILVIYIFISGKKSRSYRKALSDDKTKFDPYTETLSFTMNQQTSNNQSYTFAETKLTAAETELLTAETQLVTVETQLLTAVPQLNISDTVLSMTERASSIEQNFIAVENVVLDELHSKYLITNEIHGGGMSRIFLANHRKLGNQWIIKQIDKHQAALANEEKILKQLNHIYLPHIIDIYEDESSLFLVQRYIEGVTLNKVLGVGKPLGQSIILDWAHQLGQVLAYLHGQESPI